jgi:hypothetical protein
MNGSFDSGTNHAFRQFISALFGTGENKICFQFPSVINLMISSVFFSLNRIYFLDNSIHGRVFPGCFHMNGLVQNAHGQFLDLLKKLLKTISFVFSRQFQDRSMSRKNPCPACGLLHLKLGFLLCK